MSRVTFIIDRLALTGFEPGDRRALVEALRRELASELNNPAARAAWTSERDRSVLRLGRMPCEPGTAGGREFGVGLARAVVKGLRR
jgi:hypothetical protein